LETCKWKMGEVFPYPLQLIYIN